MNFAHPAALAWAALALPIIAFYILKVRLRRVPVSTSLFWNQVFEEKRPRSLWQHLRHLLSLLCQLALLGLLVLALGEPFLRGEILSRRRLVLVVDNSASMNAADVAPTRLGVAQRRGRAIIDALRFRDEVAVIAAGTEPRVHCGLTDHQRSLREAIDSIPPTEGPTRVAEAVALARRLLADHKNRRVIVLSDGGFDGAEELAEADDVELIPIGQRTGNVGITRFQVRRSLIDPIGYEILAEVGNFSDEPVTCRIEMDLERSDGPSDTIDVVPLKLQPGGRWTRVFEKASAQGGRLVARLNQADALAADNQAWALLPRRDRQPVTLVTPGNLFLEKVFQAIPIVALTVRKVPPDTPSGLTVFHRDLPATLPGGPVLVIDPRGSCDLWDLGDVLADPIVARQQADSPLLMHVKLDDMVMPEARKLSPRGKAQVLAQSPSGDPLLCSFDRPGGKVLVLLADLEKCELPLLTAFPILVSNALNWYSGNKGELRESVATGAVVMADASSGLPLALRAPDGSTRSLPPGTGKASLGPLDQCGVWSLVPVSTAAGESATSLFDVACNLASRRESDLRPPEDLKRVESASFSGGLLSRPLWFYLVALALGLAGLEWFLYQRRWIS